MKTNYVIGDPVDHSLSPLIHNTAYKLLGIDSEYFFEARQTSKSQLETFIDEFRQQMGCGLAVTSPNKQAIIPFLDSLDSSAKQIGAVNTVVNSGGKLTGYNTDYLGAVAAIEELTEISGKKIAVLGTGGSARAIAYGLSKKDAQITLFGRDTKKVIEISKTFAAMPADIEAKAEIANCQIIINATSVGMGGEAETELIPKNLITSDHIIFDLVYRPTLLITSAISTGATIISGRDMLINQAAPQIEHLVGQKISVDLLRKELGWRRGE